jgi:membrane protease subunit (stomatin/prohibitin family)
LTPPLEQHLNNLSVKIKLLLAQVTPPDHKHKVMSNLTAGEGISSDKATVSERQPEPSEKPRFCVQCGTPNDRALKFCTECGASLIVAAARTCRRCGASNAGGTKFCTSCGTKLD